MMSSAAKASMIKPPEVVADNAATDAVVPGPVTGITASMEPASSAEGVEVEGGRGDLTVFFAIGMVINVLLVTAFLVWAVGQWRKKK